MFGLILRGLTKHFAEGNHRARYLHPHRIAAFAHFFGDFLVAPAFQLRRDDQLSVFLWQLHDCRF